MTSNKSIKNKTSNLSAGNLEQTSKPAASVKDSLTKEEKIPKNTSLPSRFVYNIDVPEVLDLDAKFVYNFYVKNEAILDKDILSDATIESQNLAQSVISKPRSEFTDEELSTNRSKLPRYVKLSFTPPSPEKIRYANQLQCKVLSQNFDNIVKEETFSSSFFSSLVFDNNSIEQQTNVIFNGSKKYVGSIERISEVDSTIRQTISQQDLKENTIYLNGKGQEIANSYFQKFKKLFTYAQVNNALLHDVVVNSAGDPLTINSEKFKNFVSSSKFTKGIFNDYSITDSEFETSINYYKVVKKTNFNTAPKALLVGYVIEKIEIYPDGTKKVFDPIIVENSSMSSYIDFDVRYGTTYIYEIRSVVDITYAAVDNQTYGIYSVNSLIASKPKRVYVETTENIAPPPPAELRFIWDYDKINPATMEYDAVTNSLYPGTGTPGCLMITWAFPVNSQRDIKKFQVFRRKSVEEPFELLQVYDFDDAIFKYPTLESNINQNLIEYAVDPKRTYYDYDFMKDSEYIYCLASIDAHGLASNYSEQFLVKFDSYSNKLATKLASFAGSPKQYPNMFLAEDLFVDTIKTSNMNKMHFYLDPQCYSVSRNNLVSEQIIGTDKNNTSYVMNFINIENQKSAQLNLQVIDNKPAVMPQSSQGYASTSTNDESFSKKIKKSFIKQNASIVKTPKKKFKI
jgi:hypothetical protein